MQVKSHPETPLMLPGLKWEKLVAGLLPHISQIGVFLNMVLIGYSVGPCCTRENARIRDADHVINHPLAATEAELETLPGIGPTTAKASIAGGPYGVKKFEAIAPLVVE
jgi:hypothetical protein